MKTETLALFLALAGAFRAFLDVAPASACAGCGGGGSVQVNPQLQVNPSAQGMGSAAAEGGNGGNAISTPTATGGTAKATGGTAAGGSVGPITIFGGSGTGSWGNLSVPPTDGVGGTIRLPDGREITLTAQCAVGFTKAGLFGSRQPSFWTIGGDLSTTLIHGQSNCRTLQDWLIKRAEQP